MIVRELIARLEAAASPDAEVYFVRSDDDFCVVEGGMLDVGQSPHLLLLTPETCAAEGGF